MKLIKLVVAILVVASIAKANDDVRILEGHEGTVRPVVAPDGKTLATASDGQTVRLWDASDGKLQRTLQGHGYGVWRAVFSPDGKTVAAVASNRVFLWNAANGEKSRDFAAHDDTIRAVAYSPDGKTLVTGGNDETVRFWNAATGEATGKLTIDRKGKLAEIVWSIAFSPDAKTIAIGSGNGVGGDGNVRIINAGNLDVLQVLPGPDNEQIWAVAFSPDGSSLASGSFVSGKITIRSTENWKIIRHWVAEGSRRALAFSPDGKTIATGIDRDIVLWNAGTGEKERTLSGHQNFIMQITYAADGRFLVSGGSDRTARIWRLH